MPSTIDHQFVTYDEQSPELLNHAFKSGGPADVDSRLKATAWFVKYVPPTGI